MLKSFTTGKITSFKNLFHKEKMCILFLVCSKLTKAISADLLHFLYCVTQEVDRCSGAVQFKREGTISDEPIVEDEAHEASKQRKKKKAVLCNIYRLAALHLV